jgi:hypothetical protein
MLFFQQSSPDTTGAQQQHQQEHSNDQDPEMHPPFQQHQPHQQPQHHEQFAVESSDVWKTADECAPIGVDHYSSGEGKQHEEQHQHEQEERDEKQMQSQFRCEDGVSLSSMFHDITIFRDFFLAAFSDGKHSVSIRIVPLRVALMRLVCNTLPFCAEANHAYPFLTYFSIYTLDNMVWRRRILLRYSKSKSCWCQGGSYRRRFSTTTSTTTANTRCCSTVEQES